MSEFKDLTYSKHSNFTPQQIETYEHIRCGVLLTSASKNNLLYTSREFDFDTGLQFKRMRYYNPNFGRFVKKDFLDLSNSKYQFQYGFNNPGNLVDPLGLYGDWIPAFGELCKVCGGKSTSPQGNIFCYQRVRCPDPATSCKDAPDTTLCCCLYVGLP